MSSTANAGSKRGPGYTKKEDLLNCKAFIIASEDPIVGTSQKGKDFKDKHHREYVRLLSEQERIDQLQYNQGSETFHEMAGPPIVFNKRSPDSLYNRFKDHIAHRVLKFIGVEETTERESGTDDEKFFDLCNTIFKKRYPALGSFTDLRACKEYLAPMPKFMTFKVLLDNLADEKKKKRPIGTKKAKQTEGDAALIKKVLDESSVVSRTSEATSNTTEQFQQGVMSMLSNIGNSMINHWKEENEVRFVSMLPPEEQEKYRSELFKVKMLEAQAKRCRLEQEINGSSPSSLRAPPSVATLQSQSTEVSGMDDDDE